MIGTPSPSVIERQVHPLVGLSPDGKHRSTACTIRDAASPSARMIKTRLRAAGAGEGARKSECTRPLAGNRMASHEDRDALRGSRSSDTRSRRPWGHSESEAEGVRLGCARNPSTDRVAPSVLSFEFSSGERTDEALARDAPQRGWEILSAIDERVGDHARPRKAGMGSERSSLTRNLHDQGGEHDDHLTLPRNVSNDFEQIDHLEPVQAGPSRCGRSPDPIHRSDDGPGIHQPRSGQGRARDRAICPAVVRFISAACRRMRDGSPVNPDQDVARQHEHRTGSGGESFRCAASGRKSTGNQSGPSFNFLSRGGLDDPRQPAQAQSCHPSSADRLCRSRETVSGRAA